MATKILESELLDTIKKIIGIDIEHLPMDTKISTIESNFIPRVTTLCEPQLSRRGFYPDLSIKNSINDHKTIMNILAYSDGNNSLLDIANIINKPFWEILPLTKKLMKFKLLK